MSRIEDERKVRIVQEFVPGKQVTLAHVLANPTSDVYVKLGVDTESNPGALGVLTLTPSESAIIAADVASKATNISLVFVDRFSGSLVFTGKLSDVDRAINEVVSMLANVLGFDICQITRS